LDKTKLASLLDEINKINTLKDEENDIIGRVYEFFLKKFALQEGKGKGEFYTPKSVVNLICELIEPYSGIIYDPACGSGGMFVQSVKFVESHNGNKNDISIYGQEYIRTTYKLAKMNLAIRGISADLGEMEANTFLNDQHKNLKADFIMANPPFNQKKWRTEDQLVDDERWNGYETPPVGNANYGWILNMISKLSSNGVAGFLIASGALNGENEEYKIRKKIIENHLVDAIIYLPRNLFYTTDIGVSLWILSKNKKGGLIRDKVERERINDILFMDLRKFGSPYEKKYIEFTSDDIKNVSNIYHTWKFEESYKDYQNVDELCYSATLDEVKENDYSLVPSQYIKFHDLDDNRNIKEDIKDYSNRLYEIMIQSQDNTEKVIKLLEDMKDEK